MGKSREDSIAILGLGKAGTALGFLLKKAGYQITSVASRSKESLDRGLHYTGGKACKHFAEAASLASTIFITVRDDAIKTVCEKISLPGILTTDKKVVHMSGVGGLDLLISARTAGASVACIHPIQSFADVEGAIRNMPGTTFGITADDKIKDWALQIVRDLGGKPFFVTEADKALYHAAACVASNYLVTLMNSATRIYQSLGLDEAEALQAFWPLVKGTVNNIEKNGPYRSLTGPIARGDSGTIQKHLQAFSEKMPELMGLYCEMGLLAVKIGRNNQTLNEEQAREIRALLQGGKNA